MGTHDFFHRSRNVGKKGKRDKRDTFLIVCEGERTEPNYFKKFPIKTDVIDLHIKGEGKNTDSLAKEAIRLKKIAEKEGRPYVQVWVVFDRDDFPSENFNNAIKLCDDNGIRYAVTNEAFELWYLLHFGYYDSAMSRTQYEDKISELIGVRYKKNQPNMYELLQKHQDQALKNAKKLRKFQFEMHGRHDPCNTNPVTTVYELVEAINEYIED